MLSWLKQKRITVQLIIAGVGILLAGGLYVFNILSSLPNPSEIADLRVSQSTKIYDREGDTLLYEIYREEKRTVIPSGDIPDVIRDATIAIEDNSFYSHPAFDWRGILRAVAVNLIRGQVVQGGSTITQQVAKNAFLSPERTITRKIKELVLAMRLERQYSKDEILDLYLNLIPYGENAYGIESASQTFFGKRAKDLTLAEASLLAALPKSPSYFSPWGSRADELEERRLFILGRMRDLGYIDDAQHEAAKKPPEVLPQPETGIGAPHFVVYIQDYLRETYGEDALRDAGLRVQTTLDADLQKIAEDAVRNGVERNNELYGGGNGALIALDPKTGQVLAMVGSKDYFADPEPAGCTPGRSCRFEGNFNVITQGLRQPGSALKPFAYLTAFEKGLTPDTIIWDVATEFAPACPAIVNFQNRSPSCYHPQNFDGVFRGPVLMKEALAQSINVPAVKTLYLAGLSETLANASRFGITTLKDPARFGLSLVLGGGEIRPIELASAYGVLANDGVYYKPRFILKVENADGEVLEEYKDEGVRAVDAQYARLINDILSSVELRSPLFQASLGLTQVPGRQVALKTGTTDDYVDAWAFGYTPDLVVGVWAGNNNREPLTAQGSSILAAVPIWHDFISKALEKKPSSVFPRPDPVFAKNPIFRGQLIRGEFHSILYYLGRLGDPQFNNWEAGISAWLSTNSIDTSRFSFADPGEVGVDQAPAGAGQIDLTIHEPTAGGFVADGSPLSFSAQSSREIVKIEVYINNTLAESRAGNLGKRVDFKAALEPDDLNLQNLLVVRITDEGGFSVEERVVFFR